MHCVNHNQREASGSCVHCGKLFCEDCLVEIEGRYYCKEHVSIIINELKKERDIYEKLRSTPPEAKASDPSGITINNTVSSTSKATVIQKNKAPRIGCFHTLVRFFSFMCMVGFGLLGMALLVDGEFGGFLFCGFWGVFFLLIFAWDVGYCNRS